MKKFISTLVLAIFLLISTVHAAEIDWDSAPRFDNLDDLVEYINDCKLSLKTTVPVVCVNGFVPDNKKIPELRPIFYLNWTIFGNDGRILYKITNYPGERVAWAYIHGDKSFLTADELKLYDAAVEIVNHAKNFSPDPMYRELYIHDRITGRTVYHNEEPQPKFARFKTAFGVIFDGKANCQGYSDAFYMLATMCGLKTDKINGFVNNKSHTWNTVTFGDKSYFVDVTWDDSACNLGGVKYNSYIFFNAPTEIMTNYLWYDAHSPKNLQNKPDRRNFYHAKEYFSSNGKYFGASFDSAEDALKHIAYRIADQNYKISRVKTRYNARFSDANTTVNLLTKKFLQNLGWSGTVTLNVERHGDFLYFTAKSTPN